MLTRFYLFNFLSCFYYYFIACSFVAHPLLAPYVFNGRSPADLADYAEECSRAALFRRQKTASANVSAKADAADNAEKDSYHIVECCSCLYNKSVREHACSFLVLSLPFPYSFLVLSLLVLCSFLMFPCSFLMCLTAVLAFLAEIKFRN